MHFERMGSCTGECSDERNAEEDSAWLLKSKNTHRASEHLCQGEVLFTMEAASELENRAQFGNYVKLVVVIVCGILRNIS